MGIINNYDMRIIMDGSQREVLKEILRDRAFAMVEIDNRILEIPTDKRRWEQQKIFGIIEGFYHMGIRENPSGESIYECTLFLDLASGRGEKEAAHFQRDLKRAEEEGAIIRFPSEDEVLDYLQDKELVFQVAYFECAANVEQTIMEKFFEYMFLIDEEIDEETYIMFNDIYNVRIYLQNIGDQNGKSEGLQPIDIRKYDLCREMEEHLTSTTRKYYEKDMHDFIVSFQMVSREIQAQYVVTRYHSNPYWDLNPVCWFRYRISGFMLPGKAEDGSTLLDEKTVYDENHKKYRIDSIHFNSDICFDKTEFKEMIENYYLEVDRI